MRTIKALVLWHYYRDQDESGGNAADRVPYRASITEFEGTISDLQDMVKESDEGDLMQRRHSIPHQIILLPD